MCKPDLLVAWMLGKVSGSLGRQHANLHDQPSKDVGVPSLVFFPLFFTRGIHRLCSWRKVKIMGLKDFLRLASPEEEQGDVDM